MDHVQIINKLEENQQIYRSFLENIWMEQAVWKPDDNSWSLLEVINHLNDEEIHDFRQRIEHALQLTHQEWKKIEPLVWVKTNRYQNKHYIDSLNSFLTKRKTNIFFLRSHLARDWFVSDEYPYGDPMTADEILYNWLAHDYLHIRQINKLNYQYYDLQAGDIDLGYAGKW